jgi:asparagine synthase (glutamine-hydrolysing)
MKCFLKYGFIPAPLTIFKNVQKVPAGELMTLKDNTVRFRNIFDYADFKEETLKIDMPEAMEEYDRLLKKSIKRRINGFDTVGTLLSGGYDSGGNIAVLREVFEGTIKSYSVGFKDNPFSELPYAKMMADEFGAIHHECEMDGQELDQLPEAIKAFGEPFSESGFMVNNAAMRMVQNEGLPVIIGGDGNDQLMGTTGKELALHVKIKNKKMQFAQRIFKGVSANSFFEKDNILYKLRFHNEKILNVMRPDNFGFNDHLLNSLFDMKGVGEHPFVKEIPNAFSDFNELHDQHQFHLDIRHSINEVILNKASRLSAYYGNNLGFTYIDLDIYNFVKKLPLPIRLKGNLDELAGGKGVTKFIHKSYCKPKLPIEVTERKKQGGFSPLAMFFKDESQRAQVFKYISSSAFAKEFMNTKALKQFLTAYDNGVKGSPYWFWFTQLKSNQLINILIMAIWWDMYMLGKKSISLKALMEE